jgi:vancomycin resistance protein YoaR
LRFVIAGVAALLLLLAALVAWYELGHSDRIYKGVTVLGSDLSGMSRDEASVVLSVASARYPSGAVQVSGASGQNWSLSPSDLGVAVDIPRTLDAAMGIGRSGSLLDNLGAQFSAFFNGAQTTPTLKQDAAAIDRAVTQIASTVDTPAVDSKLEKDADGVVNLTASAQGIAVDRTTLAKSLSEAAAHVPFGSVTLPTQVVEPKVTEAALQDAKDQALLLTEQPVTLNAGDQTWTISPADLRDFLTINHTSDGTANAALDNNKLALFLQPISDKLRVDPQDAALVIGKGTVTLNEDSPGEMLDAPAAITAIQQAATASGDARTVSLPVNEVPAAVHTADLQALYDKTNSLVTQGLRLHFADDGYILRGASVTGFIDVKPAQGGPGPLELVIDDDVLANRVSGVAYYINRSTADARFKMVNGVPTKVAGAKQGLAVNIDQSVQNAKQAIASYTGGDRLQVELDVAVTEPNVKESDLAGINTPDLLAFGQTSYVGSSANRAWNVELGTSRIDGTLIPPGGIFSTVDTIGDLTLAAGFKMGYAIQGDGKGGLTTVPAEAGGICQVSTTLFHAVFRSGLHVVERNWHSYWISTYGRAPTGLQGLDATIAPPEKDFRFQNNTGNWVLIKASASKGTVLFQLYGVNPGWNVSIGKPVITNVVKTSQAEIVEYSDQLPASTGKVMVEHAQDGFSSSITRVVTDSSGNVVDNWTAKSIYAPAHNRYLIGTGK